MERSNAANSSVNVFFSREVDKLRFDLLTTGIEIQNMLNIKTRKNLVWFVDGPQHSDKQNTLRGSFDYFCTSGGYPVPKQAEYPKLKVWILNG